MHFFCVFVLCLYHFGEPVRYVCLHALLFLVGRVLQPFAQLRAHVVVALILQFTVPAGSGVNRTVVVSAGDQQSLPTLVSYAQPTITRVALIAGPKYTGVTLDVFGNEFAFECSACLFASGSPALPHCDTDTLLRQPCDELACNGSVPTVALRGTGEAAGTVANCAVSCMTPSKLRCSTSVAVPTGTLVVTVGGQTSQAWPFTYESALPVATLVPGSVSPAYGPTDGSFVTVQGHQLGSTGLILVETDIARYVVQGAPYADTSVTVRDVCL